MKNGLFLVLFAIAVTSCSVQQDILLRVDGSGRTTLQIELQDGFYKYLKEMNQEAGLLGLETSDRVFDLERVESSFLEFPGVDLIRAAVPNPQTLELEMAFSDVEDVLPRDVQSAGAPLFSFGSSGTRRSLEVNLTRENYAMLAPIIPGSDNPLFEVLGPQIADPYTEEEYIDVLAFMMGDESPDWVERSALLVRVRVPGRVTRQDGGRAVSGGVDFQIPLLKLLLLNEPMVYSVDFEP